MSRKSTALDVLIGAMLQLNSVNGERDNVIAFVESCFGARVRSYDFDAAQATLARLSGKEQHALIEWILHKDTAPVRKG
jgi:hypothetical protein